MPESVLDTHKMVTALAETYAEALFALTEEAGNSPEVAEELEQLANLFVRQPDLISLLHNRGIPRHRRARSLRDIFKGRVSDLVYKFLQVLNVNDRLGRLEEVAVAFIKLNKDKRGEIDVDVYSARPLDERQMRHIADRLGSALGRTAMIHPRVDESLIGGLKLRVGDRLIDGSVAAQLARVKRQLTENAREAIRRGDVTIDTESGESE